jgi:NADH:ubiquinone oxidoreductase subunit 3 (subunit A)
MTLVILGISTLILSILSVAVRQLDWLWFLPMILFFIGALLSSWVPTLLTIITPKK